MAGSKFTGTAGLALPRRAVRVLREHGIFAHPLLSVEKQQATGRYVIRGLESGGSSADVGRYVTFGGNEGQPLEWLYPVETIAVNGLHAVVISPDLIRIDVLRKGRTYELLITQHSLEFAANDGRPDLGTKILFRGIHGRLELDLGGRDKAQIGTVVPSFFSLSGERVDIPKQFMNSVRAATKGANCRGCSHSHYLRQPKSLGREQITRPHEMEEASATLSQLAVLVTGDRR